MNTVSIKNITLPGRQIFASADAVVMVAAALLGTILVVVLFFDGIIFTQTILEKPEIAAPEEKLAFPEKDVNDLVRLLDLREQEFLKIANGLGAHKK